MTTLVSVDAHAGVLARYEVGGEAVRLTHRAVAQNAPVAFSAPLVRSFRENPPEEFRIEPDPRPTNSPAGAGTPSNDEKDNGWVEAVAEPFARAA